MNKIKPYLGTAVVVLVVMVVIFRFAPASLRNAVLGLPSTTPSGS